MHNAISQTTINNMVLFKYAYNVNKMYTYAGILFTVSNLKRMTK